MKASKIILIVLSVLVGAMAVLFLAFFFNPENREYFSGETSHYIGESIISADQAVYLASKYDAGREYMDDIQNIIIQEDGSVAVTYDFYGEPGLDYLEVSELSILDAPMAHGFIQGWDLNWRACLVSIALMIIVGMLYACWSTISGYLFDAAWYILHHQYSWSKDKAMKSRYSPEIVTNINIGEVPKGILGVRTWKHRRSSNSLYSVARYYRWDRKFEYSKIVPTEKNRSGFYAFRLGLLDCSYPFANKLLGIVEMKGEFVEHADGIVRAEACELIFLIVSKRMKLAAGPLSANYGVPVMIHEKPIQAYQNWMLSKNGIACLAHNAEILKEEIEWEQQKESFAKGKSPMKSPA